MFAYILKRLGLAILVGLAVSMIAFRFFGVIDSEASKLSTRDTVVVDTPTASAISLKVTMEVWPAPSGSEAVPRHAGDASFPKDRACPA